MTPPVGGQLGKGCQESVESSSLRVSHDVWWHDRFELKFCGRLNLGELFPGDFQPPTVGFLELATLSSQVARSIFEVYLWEGG